MKICLLVSMLLAFEAFACADLSHLQKRPGYADLQVRQTSCEKWVRQQIFAGKPVGDPMPLKLGPDWVKIDNDDPYEKYTMYQKWAWTPDQSKIIHEVTSDTLTKGTRELSFHVQSSSFAIDGRFVTEKGSSLTRTLHSNGEIEYRTETIDNRYPRLE